MASLVRKGTVGGLASLLFEIGVYARDKPAGADSEIQATDLVTKIAGEIDPCAGTAIIKRRYRQQSAYGSVADEKALDIVAYTVLAIETLSSRWIVDHGIWCKQRRGRVNVESIGGRQHGGNQRLKIMQCGHWHQSSCCQLL